MSDKPTAERPAHLSSKSAASNHGPESREKGGEERQQCGKRELG